MNKHRHYAILVALMVMGFALRIYHLGATPFRGDEAFSAQYWAGIPPTQSLTTIATIEPHPPLTYLIFWAWGLVVGTTHEFALRFLPVVVNLIGIPTLYILGKRLQKPTFGILLACLWAIHPFEIWHSQDFRNYALWAGMSTQVLYWGWRAIQTRQTRYIFVYSLLALTTALTFYFELLTLAGVWLFGMIVQPQQRPFWRRWTAMHIGITSVILVTFAILQANLFRNGGYGGNTASFSLEAIFTTFPATLVFGETLPAPAYPIVGFSITVGFALLLLKKQHQRSFWFALCIAIVPLVLLSIVSTRVSVFTPRYVLAIAPALLIMLALWVDTPKRWFAKLGIFLGVVGLMAFSVAQYFTNPAYIKSPDWYSVRDYFQKNLTPEDFVLQTAVDAAFGYYFQDDARNKALPYTPKQSPDEIIAILDQITRDYHSIWLFEHSRQAWENADVAPAWLRDHWQAVRETSLIGKPLIQYVPYSVTDLELAQANPAQITFGDAARLIGYRIFRETPTHELTVWLYWQPISQTELDYTVSVQLIGEMHEGTTLWAQADHPPLNGLVQTSNWQVGTIYRDSYQLSLAGLEGKTVSLGIKLYNNELNQLLATPSGETLILLTSIEN